MPNDAKYLILLKNIFLFLLILLIFVKNQQNDIFQQIMITVISLMYVCFKTKVEFLKLKRSRDKSEKIRKL